MRYILQILFIVMIGGLYILGCSQDNFWIAMIFFIIANTALQLLFGFWYDRTIGKKK